MDIQQAAATLQQDRATRAEAALREMTAILEKYNCRVRVVITVTADGRLVGEPVIEANA